ncbi:uncharacterized protein LOC127851697 isoform X2 [Dreissena polymorpha]|uniref:PARP catalytic domain-containing protein n=2 Tax=Dreissena polymorpha TaxID=45954 RepID=A0A9D4D318_DREPO|nr:uncharacterized protein LOC127851697 isoform X2 [Dreissena polymorpha]KAH3737234.1 hypothetical protein DPMN_043816 [Dreissena polymorpha]
MKAKLQTISNSKQQELEEVRRELKLSQEQTKAKAEMEQIQATIKELQSKEQNNKSSFDETKAIENAISRLEAEIEKLQRLHQQHQVQPSQSLSGIRLPLHWKKMQIHYVLKVTLDVMDSKERQEYSEVQKHFLRTLPHVTVVSITRFQNALHWEYYQLKKLEME